MLFILSRLVFVFMFFGGSVAFASCPVTSMSTGWCWPTERGDWSNNLAWHGSNAGFAGSHLAKDIDADEGDLVYAMAKGIVLITRNDVSYYGGATDCNSTPRSISGSGVVIRYYTSNGSPVDVLYAHIKNIRVKKGEVVEAGEIVGEIRNYTWCGSRMDHLHLGVAYKGRNISVYDKSGTGDVWSGYGTTDKGFVDPVYFFFEQSNGRFLFLRPS